MTQHRDIYIEMHEGRTTRIVVHRNIEHKHEVTETTAFLRDVQYHTSQACRVRSGR